jgi:predicted transcriptional regulator
MINSHHSDPLVGNKDDLTERFEVAFNLIHNVLKRLNPYEENDAFTKMLSVSRRKHAYLNSFYYELKQFAKLRNALVHEKFEKQTYIATPHEKTVEIIERIAKYLSQPPSVMEIATKEVIQFKLTDSLETIVKQMKVNSYHQFPVYGEDKFAFLLTDRGVTKWFSSHIKNGVVEIAQSTATDLLSYENDHYVLFVSTQMNIFELEEIYEKSFKENRKLEAVIVTEKGSPLEQPLGMITSWDLIEIDLLYSEIIGN